MNEVNQCLAQHQYLITICIWGGDKFDQLMAAYNISWKSRRWWLKIFYYMLDCCIVNSFVCYKEDTKNKNICHNLSFGQN